MSPRTFAALLTYWALLAEEDPEGANEMLREETGRILGDRSAELLAELTAELGGEAV